MLGIDVLPDVGVDLQEAGEGTTEFDEAKCTANEIVQIGTVARRLNFPVRPIPCVEPDHGRRVVWRKDHAIVAHAVAQGLNRLLGESGQHELGVREEAKHSAGERLRPWQDKRSTKRVVETPRDIGDTRPLVGKDIYGPIACGGRFVAGSRHGHGAGDPERNRIRQVHFS
jgi:hypothetical protein